MRRAGHALVYFNDMDTATWQPFGVRMDPHPAWDPTFRFVAFNACPDGPRRVYVADLGALLER